MSKRNYTVDTKEMKRLEKQIERVEYLKARILKDLQELNSIKESERWLNYLGKNATETLTENENYRLAEINDKIKYAYNDIKKEI